MRIVYHNRRPNPQAEQELGAEYRSLEALLAEADAVVLATPGGADTRHLINKAALGQMKKSAYLVNVGRGTIVDQEALFEALSSGIISGAGLDVTDPEPLPSDHPLLTLENCTIIPHIGTASWETRALMARVSVDNLLRGLRGEKMQFCANPEVYQTD